MRVLRAPTRPCLALVGACLALACASPIKTAFDTNPDANMAAYKTYAWVSDGSIRPAAGVQYGPYVSPLDDQRIRREVESRLQAKGYVRQDISRADLIVSYGVRSEEKVTVRQDPGRSSYYTGGYGRGTWYSSSAVSVHQYTEGTMTIEFFDRETQDALWVGWGSKRLSTSDDREELIQEVVQKILEPFPGRT